MPIPRHGSFPCGWARVMAGIAIVTLGLSAAVSSEASAVPGNAPLEPSKTVGSLTLRACGRAGAYCGRLERPLDPSGAMAERLFIYFEFYPHTAPGRASGTLVATEGGPGYPATESRDDYLALFRPLMAHRDVLIMDNRGTGRSGAIDCHALQTAATWTVELVAACGESLGARAPFYGTAYAADDLAALLRALDVAKIDLYGDSYGTYFEQVFALRHPALLHSLVLDGAYPLRGPDYAWYPTYAPAMRAKFNIACERSPPCAALAGDSIAHIMPTLERLRAAPFRAQGYDADGRARDFRASASQLAIVMFGNAPDLATARETDAAARAFALGDRAPLLRLMAETAAAVDSRDPADDPTQWSAGLAAAVMCQDPPQIVDMSLAPAQRLLELERVLAERRRTMPDTYAPFTIDEYRAMPLDYSFLDQCVGWPVPAAHPQTQAFAEAAYPDIPALVVSGELDDITTLADGAAVAAAFKHGLQIRIANSFHVNALPRARSPCAADIVRRFLAEAAPGDTSCAARVPPLRLVPRFAVKAADLDAARALPANAASAAQLRLAAAALQTAGDVLARVRGNSSGQGVGLRGGTFRIRRDAAGIHLTLRRVQWVEDAAISGSIERAAGGAGRVRATLQIAPAQGVAGQVRLEWSDTAVAAQASLSGHFGGARLAASSPAP